MQIAILGTGRMAKGIAWALRDTPHDLTLASRDAARAEVLAREMTAENARKFHGATYAAAAARADVTFLAVPWAAAAGVVESLRDALAERVLVDLTNPLNERFDGLLVGDGTSGSEELARTVGPRVRLVAALKNTFAGTFAEPHLSGGPAPDVLIAGDDAAAKDEVARLVEAMGFGALDAGPLAVARTIERMTVLLIQLATKNHWNWNAGFKLVH